MTSVYTHIPVSYFNNTSTLNGHLDLSESSQSSQSSQSDDEDEKYVFILYQILDDINIIIIITISYNEDEF